MECDEPMSKEKNESILNCMKHIRIICDFIHMWPRQRATPMQKLKHSIIVFFNFIYLSLIVIGFTTHIVVNFKTMDGIAKTVDHVTAYTSSTFRYIYVALRNEKYLKLLKMIRNGFISQPMFDNNSKDVLKKFCKQARNLVLVLNVPIIFWCIQAAIMPILRLFIAHIKKNESEEANATDIVLQAPIGSYFPMDAGTFTGSVLFYFWEIYGITMTTIIYLCVDNFWIITIVLTIGQFEILKKCYENILDFPDDPKYPEEVELLDKNRIRRLEERLKKCIKHHNFLREFTRLVDDLMNPIILIDYFHAIISMAFLLLEVTITIKAGKWSAFSYAIQYLVLSVGHIFLFNWLGNKLVVKENELCEAIYDLPWYKFPLEKHSICLVALVSRRPHELTGGRTFKLTLPFFTATLRAIFSYFMFLLQLRNKTETSNKILI